MCPECGFQIGSNEIECENCYHYNDSFGPDYYADRDGETWEEIIDRLRDRQDEPK